MTEFVLMCPTEDELTDAEEALEQILDLGECGEVDLPPYLTRLLLQLEDILLATYPQPLGGTWRRDRPACSDP